MLTTYEFDIIYFQRLLSLQVYCVCCIAWSATEHRLFALLAAAGRISTEYFRRNWLVVN